MRLTEQNVQVLRDHKTKVKITEDFEGNNCKNKIGIIDSGISDNGNVYIIFNDDQIMRERQWWVPISFIQFLKPSGLSFINLE